MDGCSVWTSSLCMITFAWKIKDCEAIQELLNPRIAKSSEPSQRLKAAFSNDDFWVALSWPHFLHLVLENFLGIKGENPTYISHLFGMFNGVFFLKKTFSSYFKIISEKRIGKLVLWQTKELDNQHRTPTPPFLWEPWWGWGWGEVASWVTERGQYEPIWLLMEPETLFHHPDTILSQRWFVCSNASEHTYMQQPHHWNDVQCICIHS